MGLRAKLILVLVIPVLVPIAALTAVTLVLAQQAPEGKADASLATATRAAGTTVDGLTTTAGNAARRIAGDARLARAMRRRDAGAMRARAEQLRTTLRLSRVDVTVSGAAVRTGASDAAIPARAITLTPGGDQLGEVVAWATRAPELATTVHRLTGLAAVVPQGGAGDGPSEPETVDRNGEEVRAASLTRPGPRPLHITLYAPLDDARTGTLALALAGALLLALLGVVLGSRVLLQQVGEVLTAARRIGEGDLDTRVPVRGRDAFAALAVEFNRMAVRLRARLDELGRERRRLDTAVRRVGESLASGLDADSALAVAVRQAVDALGADAGRASERDGNGLVRRAAAGDAGAHEELLARAEERAITDQSPVRETGEDSAALAYPLGGGDGAEAVVAVVRAGEPFSDEEQALFAHLARGAGRTLTNVERHEQAQVQASTDELTGLANHRRFQEVMAAEIERSRRFGQPLGLVLLDIDDFKQVNDTHGHQRGDDVLRGVARALRECTREIDEPARYGGEELVVALPGTDLAGATELAERVRRAVDSVQVENPGGDPIRVTASFGVAAYPVSAEDRHGLVAAADAALYEAKRGGKNRVVQAR
jgi:diguanylate cyclase (GGDEF)-like protein